MHDFVTFFTFFLLKNSHGPHELVTGNHSPWHNNNTDPNIQSKLVDIMITYFERLPKFIQKKLHHICVDGTKLAGQCNNSQEAKKKLKLILKEIDFIHLPFNESEGELLKIAREKLADDDVLHNNLPFNTTVSKVKLDTSSKKWITLTFPLTFITTTTVLTSPLHKVCI
ncbi:hypothetical protein Glove_309g36 [Diversispora epigaea]|uniref:Uncharacterized protein n=1 Tax=Diversispora epigaea TaxID=1348612 RepID=A0A397HYD2_9GLOM|nr:hypothetical protein Glove_309g36 [Diversispora epigaea]